VPSFTSTVVLAELEGSPKSVRDSEQSPENQKKFAYWIPSMQVLVFGHFSAPTRLRVLISVKGREKKPSGTFVRLALPSGQ